MATDESGSGDGFVRAFLPGLVLGLVVGAFAGAFVVPVLTESSPVKGGSVAGGGTPSNAPPRTRERGEAPLEDRDAPDGIADEHIVDDGGAAHDTDTPSEGDAPPGRDGGDG